MAIYHVKLHKMCKIKVDSKKQECSKHWWELGRFCKAAISLKMCGLMAMFGQCLLASGFGRPDRESTAAGFGRFDRESGLAGFGRSDQESWLAGFGRFDHYRVKATHDGFCVEINQTMLQLDRKQKWLRMRSWVSPKLRELLNEKFVNRISNN